MCVTVNFSAGTCFQSDIGDLVNPVAYSVFDPTNLAANFLGTVGRDSPRQFQFSLEAGDSFVIIGQMRNGIGSRQGDGIGCTYGVAVEYDETCGG